MLYIVATPIGNLADITLRALEVLKSCDLIACEDTRQTQKLLNHYEIAKPLTSYYEHNKLSKGEYLIKLLKEGKNIALVSDSGTPAISDPGFHIVKLALENDIAVSPIPGPSAMAAALSVCGIPANRFIFEGFLPIKPGPRKKILSQLLSQEKTIILYESPYRFLRLLDEIREVSPDAEITVCREITKKFEEIKKGAVDSIITYYKANKIQATKGEFVVVLNHK
ncbi:MAG: 16S rRNA (cytidine(1402)-2'-O)-methyltransferase [Candidatus Omnitrophica bacterium]|nr:16S rRNA (cytidine(1402)-2'-O)-methyltransferase [Candidatus Omnitrophota bacterium]MDD5351623.1 16S rRNA (cytidine(1402)-2'-O)-methyltransferase [Candidatus Omnitrophota bacterium]MDD5550833.1 16S rRNA (cytidine(1402)-2'-O)-methyltransferase [Candidatus Omnitrophota bacterium]